MQKLPLFLVILGLVLSIQASHAFSNSSSYLVDGEIIEFNAMLEDMKSSNVISDFKSSIGIDKANLDVGESQSPNTNVNDVRQDDWQWILDVISPAADTLVNSLASGFSSDIGLSPNTIAEIIYFITDWVFSWFE